MSNFKFPLKMYEMDNGACGDPECCGDYQEWVEISDANGKAIFDGRYGDEDQLALIEKAFRSLQGET